MKKLIKKILIILSCVALCLTLTACDTGFGSLKYTEVSGSDIPNDAVIAQNSKYILEVKKGLMLVEKYNLDKEVIDVVIPADLSLSEKELEEKIINLAKLINPIFECVITFDNDFCGH